MAALADAGRDPWMWRLMPAALVLAIVGSIVYPWGVV
jgi:hypothetical protein